MRLWSFKYSTCIMMEAPVSTTTIEGLFARYETLKAADNSKNQLIEELLYCLNTLDEEYQKEKLDHERERHYNRDGQKREQQLSAENRMLKQVMSRDPFVLVLIDGDGMIFNDDLLQKGDQGGREASSLLWSRVRDFVADNIRDLLPDVKIVTRIYANVKGLAETCWKAGIVEKPSMIQDFILGFTGSKQLFDFIDVGSGKERADAKLTENFKLHLYDCHCRHILFGCSHDNGYARVFEETLGDEAIVKGITLLEGVPFERELAVMKNSYACIKFDGLFRDTKVNINTFKNHSTTPSQNHNVVGMVAPSPRTNSTASVPSPSLNASVPTWATTVMAPPVHVVSTPQSAVVTPRRTSPPGHSNQLTIARNRFQQRIDLPIAFDKTQVARIKQMKVCNNHYLRGDCPYGDSCIHDHSWKPNKNELQTLRHIARWTPCSYGTDCDDPKCIYGHQCVMNTPGKKDCFYGSKCYFPPELHGVDTTPVSVVKV